MLPRAATIAPLTACTMPGMSAQLKVSTQWFGWSSAGGAVVAFESVTSSG